MLVFILFSENILYSPTYKLISLSSSPSPKSQPQIPNSGGQQEEEHVVVHHDQGEH